MTQRPIIGIVGPCGSGKSTLVTNLIPYSIQARHIAQEHSYVKDMWQRITNPDILIFLDVSFLEATRRRRLDWTFSNYLEQHHRLRDAFLHADLYIYTDGMPPAQVLAKVVTELHLTLTSPGDRFPG